MIKVVIITLHKSNITNIYSFKILGIGTFIKTNFAVQYCNSPIGLFLDMHMMHVALRANAAEGTIKATSLD